MTPFARQEALHRAAGLPQPRILPVNREDMSTHEVLALAESGDEGGIGGEQRSVDVLFACLRLGVFHGC